MCFEIVKIYFVENIIFKKENMVAQRKNTITKCRDFVYIFHSKFKQLKLIKTEGKFCNIDTFEKRMALVWLYGLSVDVTN